VGSQHRRSRRAVDTVTTPLLLKLVQTGKLRPAGLVTHRFGLDDIMQAYDTFADDRQDVCAQGRSERPWVELAAPSGDSSARVDIYARQYP